jgi:hypothetical protein
MSYYELLLSLRQRLISAMANQDRNTADDLFTTLSMLREVSYETNDEALTGLIVDLVDAARDVVMGVKGKSQIPSIEAIQAVFPPNQKAS